jgi:hypothetical protein
MPQTCYRMVLGTPIDQQPDVLHLWIDRAIMAELLSVIATCIEGDCPTAELEFCGSLTKEP